MAKKKTPKFNVFIIGQQGRLSYEAVLFAASFRHFNPNFPGKLYLGEPQANHRWEKNPTIQDKEILAALERLEVEILPFENAYFGQYYPYGNKIEGLSALPEGEPFVFFDTDTLVMGDLTEVPFDFERPSASLKVEGTWPTIELYGPGYGQIWKSLYDRFDLEFESTLDLFQPDEFWRRYLYFNAGFFYYKDPKAFGQRFLHYARTIRDQGLREIECQTLDPWLDQVALPLVIHSLGGGRDALEAGWLDGQTTCHYRLLPLLYARERQQVVDVLEEVTSPNWVKKVLKNYDPMKRMIYQGKGAKARALFDQDNLPRREQAIRNKLKRENLWLR